MSDYELVTPQLRFIAEPLREFANQHDVPTTDEAISFEQRTAPDQVRRHGHVIGDSSDRLVASGLGHKFEVREIAKTIPLFLGRLALYERGHLGSREGVWFDEIRWMRLANIAMGDSRIDDILAIIGASRTPEDPVLLDLDGYLTLDDSGDVTRQPVPYTRHPFAGDNYAARVSQTVLSSEIRLPIALIDLSLPDKKYVPGNER